MRNAKLVGLAIVLALFGVGCGSTSSSTSDSNGDGTISGSGSGSGITAPPINPPSVTVTNTTATNTVTFTPVSLGELNSYVGLHPLNAPTNIQLTVKTYADSRNRYYGDISISYNDTGVAYASDQSAQGGQNYYDHTLNNNNQYNNEYNYWWNYNGSTVFSGFFQDAYGSLVLVVTGYTSVPSGDGLPGDGTVSGEIWYRNFGVTSAPQSPYRECWFITLGPYQCGSSEVINKSDLRPTDTYRLLGTFSGLSRQAAFGN